MSTDSGAQRIAHSGSPFCYVDIPYNSYDEFADVHDVYPEFLPFDYRMVEPIACLRHLSGYLSNRPPTTQRLTDRVLTSELDAYFDPRANVLNLDEIMLAHGWWVGGERTRGRYYCNPDYVHSHREDAVTDADARRDLLMAAAAYGLRARSLAPAFDCSPANQHQAADIAVLAIARRLEVPWRETRAAGITTMARTFKTINAWGHSHREIGEAFGHPRRTITEWINREAPDFDPPADPTIGFARPSGGGRR